MVVMVVAPSLPAVRGQHTTSRSVLGPVRRPCGKIDRLVTIADEALTIAEGEFAAEFEG
jgi:hypothetical protein